MVRELLGKQGEGSYKITFACEKKADQAKVCFGTGEVVCGGAPSPEGRGSSPEEETNPFMFRLIA